MGSCSLRDREVRVDITKSERVSRFSRDVVLENGGFREHFFHQQYSNCFVYNAEWSGSGMGEKERARQIGKRDPRSGWVECQLHRQMIPIAAANAFPLTVDISVVNRFDSER